MSSAEGLDIRAPIGGLFSLLGLMLVGYGLLASGSGGPSDLWWGAVMLAFGIIMLLMARRAMSRAAPPPDM
jgi:tellurite resistance protein TehA-like permease